MIMGVEGWRRVEHWRGEGIKDGDMEKEGGPTGSQSGTGDIWGLEFSFFFFLFLLFWRWLVVLLP